MGLVSSMHPARVPAQWADCSAGRLCTRRRAREVQKPEPRQDASLPALFLAALRIVLRLLTSLPLAWRWRCREIHLLSIFQ